MTSLEAVTRAALGVSLFVTFLLLWLGITTLLAARRRHLFGRAAGVALLLASAFFLSHAMIVGKGPTSTGSGMEFWWRIGWLPAVSAPLSWYATVIRYAGMGPRLQRLHQRLWVGFAILCLLVLVLLVTDNPFANYRSLLVGNTAPIAGNPRLLVWLYLGLNIAGFGLPVVALASGRRQQVAAAHSQARPWLIGASLCLLGASAIVAVAAAWAVENAIPLLEQLPQTVTLLLAADLAAESLVACGAVLLGRAVVAYEVFTERPLPRQGFFRRWRSVVLAAATCSATVTGLLAIEARPLYGLTLLSLLGMSAYALFTWQSYRAHERFIARLLPFVQSLSLADHILGPDAAEGFAGQAADLLRALCEEALETTGADLILAGEAPRRISYRRAGFPDAPLEEIELRIPVAGGPGTSGTLLLPPKSDGRAYSAEEIELAQACGERLLDSLAGERIGRTLMELLRRRLGELQVVSTRHRRVLHDEVLPQIHLALLRLRGEPEASAALTRAHQTLSEMLQTGPQSAAGLIASRGFLGAIRETIDREFAASFRSIQWEIEEEATRAANEHFGAVAAEVLYYASLEAVRNAARHASGGDPARALSLRITARWRDGLDLLVEDDGVGLLHGPAQPGERQGLLIHTTMMAVVGGSLTLAPGDHGQGTAVRLWLPAASLSEDAIGDA
jgi:signal transduction histidine kinase